MFPAPNIFHIQNRYFHFHRRLRPLELGAGDYQVTLWVRAGEWSKEIPFLVKERKFSNEEKKESSFSADIIRTDSI